MSILELKNANKTYGEGHKKVEAMKNTNFVAEQGELIAIIGPSGSGKSTFLTIAGGLQSPSEGSVFINGHDFTNMKEKQRAATRLQEVGFILQASNLVPFLTVAEQLTLSDKVKKDNMDEAERDRLLTELDITDLMKKYPSDLSGGERQRVAIAKALYTKPSLILADEPTASLDSDRAFEVMKILSRETKENKKATIMVTHDQRLTKFCDRVYKIVDGKLNEEPHTKA